MTVCQLVYEDLNAARGESPDAKLLKESLGEVFRDLCRSEALGSARRHTLRAIDETADECRVDNWDSYGAQAVRSGALSQARRFARVLPPEFPPPDVGVDPDGEVSFEWDLAPRQVLSVSISQEGRLSFAALFGEERIHGTEYLRATVPPFILMSLKRLLRTVH